MRKKGVTKGIFCLEGLWNLDLRDTSTVRPLLELLRLNENVPYIHREFGTRDEFEYYIDKWPQKRYAAYPILYLAGHGQESGIRIGREHYPIDEIAERLRGRCENRVILFASCSTLAMDTRSLKKSLKATGALAVCGYKVDVSWMQATSFELLLLSQLQDNEFSGRGIESIERAARKAARAFPDLDFRIISVKKLS